MTENMQWPAAGAETRQIVVGLGASTGGTEATLEVLRRLPKDAPGMVIVQHMTPGFTELYARRLDRLCPMEVREAKSGDEIRPGLVLLAPSGLQCRVERTPMGNYLVRCDREEPTSRYCPSVDTLFRSMAANVRCAMIGILLTGMGRDGAEGLLEMRRRGAYTIAQDEESSVVYGMPKAAWELGAAAVRAPCDRIADLLLCRLQMQEK